VAERSLPSVRSVATAAVALFIFFFVFLFRYNDPGGSFAGLTDDHFFYLTRGWQILFGDLPVRDYVDHGAPLYYYVGAFVQTAFGRGTVSEVAFSSAMLALSAALVFWLGTRASGWIVLGFVAALVFVCLSPRFYNYPKFITYAVAIPLLWAFADAPGERPRLWLAVVTVVAFLFRHDHGAFIGLSTLVLILLLPMRWTERAKHAVVYGLLVGAMAAPYLWFIERNGGVRSYFEQASAWADRDRDRAPIVWPGPFENPDGVSDATRNATGLWKPVEILRDNMTAWVFYVELALPLFALFVLWMSSDGGRPDWLHAKPKMATVAILGIMLDGYFLRSPLDARLADPSVPLVILLAWVAVAVPRMLVSPASLSAVAQSRVRLVRPLIAVGLVAMAMILGLTLSKNFYRRLDQSGMVERWGKPFERAEYITESLRRDWDLRSWESRQDRPELITLSMYVNACTAPTDRVLVQGYLPQVLALARRAFAGGHADLRPGFFATESAQRLTLARLQRQHVPIMLLDTDRSLENFRKSFPIVTEYIDREYRLFGTHEFDGRFGLSLFVRKDLTPNSTWEPLGWPCYGTGHVG
jgi:hypothetical protein